MSRNIKELEKRVKAIEEYVVKKNSTNVFDNMTFLIGMLKEFDSSMGRLLEQMKMIQGEIQYRVMFESENGLDDKKYKTWRENKAKEASAKEKDELEKRLNEQKDKLEELEGGN